MPVLVVSVRGKPLSVEPSSRLLELALPTGAVVRFPAGTEPAYLCALLTELVGEHGPICVFPQPRPARFS